MTRIGVIGAGIMGSGIAQVCAQAGYEVIIRDIEERFVEKGLQAIRDSLDRMVEKEKLVREEAEAVMGRIKGTIKLEDIAQSELIIEAVIEKKEPKRTLYQELESLCDPKVIIASNTSSLSITELASFSNRPNKFVGLHFFNPVPVMELVEIIRGLETSDETFNIVKEVVDNIGKVGIEINDSPGFAVNRILVPMLNEAAFALMEGIASREDIDNGMKLGCNHPIGPLALMDMIGLETILSVMESFYSEFGDPKYRPCPLLKQKVRAGHLGRKTGKGFYEYDIK
ncbi:MAG: 3-hydroxybutyryl-CoA dehydrogenase [Desulfobacterales bacterium]|nr:3-hydroxybutyryl-CoA dehydrogenase [Desulfobacteraceae bacterium]MBT7086633.1 3-hydroxybutyryl-CoA dehydrogenase [Desulfobacterales bacterium]MBT7696855.1 3-hydroxybutyryl-CoA dehydrogenase [Desulfobacterales bacterium]